MSETSADYQVGFAKLLPEIWTPAQRCHEGNWDIRSETPTECLTCGANTEGYGPHEMPCPDIRDQGNEALAWKALTRLPKGHWVWRCVPSEFTTELYAAIAAIGRTP